MQKNHYYKILDKKTKEIIFSNTNKACFAEFDDREYLFQNGRVLEIYWFKNKIKDQKLIKTSCIFLDYLKNCGFPVSYREEGNQIVIIIDFDKAISKQMVTLTLHIARYAWDMGGPEYLFEVKKYQELHKCPYFHAFTIYNSISKDYYPSHNYFYTRPYKLIGQKEIRNILKEFKDDIKINDYKICYFFRKMAIDNPLVIKKFNNKKEKTIETLTPKIYKEIINEKE